jgi:hypothetical protein
MSQSLANIVAHLVFSTKGRRQLLRDDERGQLHAYITGILENHDSPLIEINSVADHIHMLFAQSKNHAPANSSSRSRVPPLAGSSGNMRRIPILRGRPAMANSASARCTWKPFGNTSAIRPNITGRRASRMNSAGFARKTENHWMTDMRGIESGSGRRGI